MDLFKACRLGLTSEIPAILKRCDIVSFTGVEVSPTSAGFVTSGLFVVQNAKNEVCFAIFGDLGVVHRQVQSALYRNCSCVLDAFGHWLQVGISPLHVAATRHTATVALLLLSDADVDARDNVSRISSTEWNENTQEKQSRTKGD